MIEESIEVWKGFERAWYWLFFFFNLLLLLLLVLVTAADCSTVPAGLDEDP